MYVFSIAETLADRKKDLPTAIRTLERYVADYPDAVARGYAEQRIKLGITAVPRKDGGLDLDASRVAADAQPLPSGTTLEAKTKLQVTVQKYKSTHTLVAIGAGIVGLLILFWILKMLSRLGVVVISLALSCGVAVIGYPLVVPWVERAYAYIDERQGDQGDKMTPAEVKETLKDAAKTATGGAESGTPMERAKATGQKVEQVVRNIPRPSPPVVAFFGTWLTGFVVIQLILSQVLRPRKAAE